MNNACLDQCSFLTYMPRTVLYFKNILPKYLFAYAKCWHRCILHSKTVNMKCCLRPTSRYETRCLSWCSNCIEQYQCLQWSISIQFSGSMVQLCSVEDVYGSTIGDHQVIVMIKSVLSGCLPLNASGYRCLSLRLSPAPPTCGFM